jgi:hypothetical protein
MSDAGLMRLLEICKRDLGAVDARIEIGGVTPSEPPVVWVALSAHRRVVVRFAEEPEEREAIHTRLTALAEAFWAAATNEERGSVPPPAAQAVPMALALELEGICARTSAIAALIVDGSSPVIWGGHPASLGDDVEPLLVLAEHPPTGDDTGRIRRDAGWAIALGRAAIDDSGSTQSLHLVSRDQGRGTLLRGIAGAYVLALLFEGGFSELRAHGVVERARDRLDKLIARLPPIDPSPRGGNVVRLRR